MRAKIREAIENANLKSAAELDDFLAELEEQARRRGRVTALDVAPGLAKCREYDEPEKAARFSERMMELQRELSPTQPEPPPDLPAARTRAAELLQSIRTSRGAERQKLVLAYVRELGQLPEEERAELEQQLNETAGRKPPAMDVGTLDALYQGIERAADDEERRALIREYRSLVAQLPAEESAERLAALNRFAKPGSRTKPDIEP